tara:strand:- start:485 stop:1156 length:672 start_codon:yes stop_codon:yes gene_type:complete
MVSKFLFYLIFAIFISINSYAVVLYDKNNLIITDIDINIYKELYKNSYGAEINNTNSLKDLILIKKVIKDLTDNNPDFIDKIDNEISRQYGKEISENSNLEEFLRFAKIRDEFILNYFQNKLEVSEIVSLFNSLDNLNLPISDSNCLIINEVIDLKNNKEFAESLFLNLKNNTNNFNVIINKKKYKVCIDEIKFKKLENVIIKYIQNQTKDEFTEFVYGKASN